MSSRMPGATARASTRSLGCRIRNAAQLAERERTSSPARKTPLERESRDTNVLRINLARQGDRGEDGADRASAAYACSATLGSSVETARDERWARPGLYLMDCR